VPPVAPGILDAEVTMNTSGNFLKALTLASLFAFAAPACSSEVGQTGAGGGGSGGGGSSASGSSASSSGGSSSSGFGGDNCTQGDNMTSPALAGGLEQGSDGAQVRILWDPGTGRGAELPSSYFDTVTVEGPDAAAVSQVKLTKEREITVTFVDLAPILAAQSSLSFSLVFPDRREFIMCSHPGMADRYLLDVTLTFDQNGAIAGSELKQHIQLGDI
jgi:hypothetical protein